MAPLLNIQAVLSLVGDLYAQLAIANARIAELETATPKDRDAADGPRSRSQTQTR